MRWIRVAAWLMLGGLILSGAAEAGQNAPAASPSPLASLELPFVFDGPPPPLPPEVLTRDDSGRATMRAVRVSVPLRIDGRLDEGVYTSVPPASDFIQIEPQAGLAATEKTDVWITFDNANVYVSVRCWASQPERIIANEMRRDVFIHDDYVDFIFDTFYDRRNAV
ncbi:MAG TPA: hypothetical protein VGQ10_06770, partial [Vicinamibacterales bacterium]|nr:hypothetical protein [Vicinamibacterales bacterium]